MNTRLPNKTNFLLHYYGFWLALVVFSLSTNFKFSLINLIALFLLTLLVFVGGRVLFWLVQNVERQYRAGFGQKGYQRLKTLRLILLFILIGLTFWGWALQEETFEWILLPMAYWVNLMLIWFISLWVLWPIAYFKQPMEERDHLFSTEP